MGYHFRTKGCPYWCSPDNFHWDPTVKPTSHMVIIRTTNKETQEVSYYNSIIECAKIMNIWVPGTNLNSACKRITHAYNGYSSNDPVISKHTFTKMRSCGSFVHPCGKVEDLNVEDLEK